MAYLERISVLSDAPSFGSGDKLYIEKASGVLHKIDYSDLPGTDRKNGNVAGGSFSGAPRTFAVVFSTAFTSNSYSVTITGEDKRFFSVDSKTAAGFTINANSATALSGNVFWQAILNGET